MIENVRTGERIKPIVRPVRPAELQPGERGWRFDWLQASKAAKVYALIDPRQPGVPLGRIALSLFEDQHVEIDLLEVNARDVGRTGSWRGIAGSLIAYAAQVSVVIGGEGFVALYAKTELLAHDETKYGFRRVGQSLRMILDPMAAAKLVNFYWGTLTDG